MNFVAILKDFGIHEYEGRVVNQLLEITYRYVSSVLGELKLSEETGRRSYQIVIDCKL